MATGPVTANQSQVRRLSRSLAGSSSHVRRRKWQRFFLSRRERLTCSAATKRGCFPSQESHGPWELGVQAGGRSAVRPLTSPGWEAGLALAQTRRQPAAPNCHGMITKAGGTGPARHPALRSKLRSPLVPSLQHSRFTCDEADGLGAPADPRRTVYNLGLCLFLPNVTLKLRFVLFF